MVVRGRILIMLKIQINESLDHLNRAAAGLFVAIAENVLAEKRRFSVALSGGSTPRAMYSRLASDEFRDKIDWSKVTFFFGDERNVPPDSPESNFRMANETILEPLAIPSLNVHRWQIELGPAEAAARYQKELETSGPLDLVLLGLGQDAHTASLFPHTSALGEQHRLAVANWVEKFHDHRLTMTPLAINRASNAIFLVAGEEKAEAVAAVLEGKFRPDDLPAQLVATECGTVYWLLDKPAASRLSSS
jgi:6-phosphogluconolactonase